MANIKRAGRRLLNFILSLLVIPLAPLFGYAARFGVGSKACLRAGFLPLPIHFYSPVPDPDDLAIRKIWDIRSELPGVDFRVESQVALLSEIGSRFGQECNWPAHSTGNSKQFYTENSSFSFGCAASAHSILRYFKPRHVVEIGSGNSSKVISQALLKNSQDSEYVIIDPYPGQVVENDLPGVTRLIKQRVELQNPDYFSMLGENDVLFIDSGHTARIGGDVNYLFLEVLPRLAPGVIIHIHDIPLPWDYPQAYFTKPVQFLWTESYLLQAFLTYNSEFEVLLAMRFLLSDHMPVFRAAFPFYNPVTQQANSGSFWIRRKK